MPDVVYKSSDLISSDLFVTLTKKALNMYSVLHALLVVDERLHNYLAPVFHVLFETGIDFRNSWELFVTHFHIMLSAVQCMPHLLWSLPMFDIVILLLDFKLSLHGAPRSLTKNLTVSLLLWSHSLKHIIIVIELLLFRCSFCLTCQ